MYGLFSIFLNRYVDVVFRMLGTFSLVTTNNMRMEEDHQKTQFMMSGRAKQFAVSSRSRLISVSNWIPFFFSFIYTFTIALGRLKLLCCYVLMLWLWDAPEMQRDRLMYYYWVERWMLVLRYSLIFVFDGSRCIVVFFSWKWLFFYTHISIINFWIWS